MDAPPGFGGAAAPGFGDAAPPGFGGAVVESSDTSQALALLKELDLKVTEDSIALMPAFLSTIKHDAHVVVRLSIATGTRLFHVVLEQLALQLDKCGKVERWLEEMWGWIVKFKEAMYGILTPEPGPVGIKILAVKFLEAYLLFFTSEASNIKVPCTEGMGKKFSRPFFTEGNSLNPSLFESEAKGTLSFLFDILLSASSFHGSLIIVVINCLTTIARNSPAHYKRILSVLLDCDSNLEILKRAHVASIRFSLRTSLLRFLKCTHPIIVESRDELLKALRAMNPGEATEQIIRRLEKMPKGAEHYAQDVRLVKGDSQFGRGVISEKPPAETETDFVQENFLNGVSLSSLKVGGEATEVKKMMSKICSLMAQGERAIESLDFLISTIDPELMADIVIHNMKLLPESPPTMFGRHKDLKIDLHGSTSHSQHFAFAAGSMAVHVPNDSVDMKRDGRGFSARVYSPHTR